MFEEWLITYKEEIGDENEDFVDKSFVSDGKCSVFVELFVLFDERILFVFHVA